MCRGRRALEVTRPFESQRRDCQKLRVSEPLVWSPSGRTIFSTQTTRVGRISDWRGGRTALDVFTRAAAKPQAGGGIAGLGESQSRVSDVYETSDE